MAPAGLRLSFPRSRVVGVVLPFHGLFPSQDTPDQSQPLTFRFPGEPSLYLNPWFLALNVQGKLSDCFRMLVTLPGKFRNSSE